MLFVRCDVYGHTRRRHPRQWASVNIIQSIKVADAWKFRDPSHGKKGAELHEDIEAIGAKEFQPPRAGSSSSGNLGALESAVLHLFCPDIVSEAFPPRHNELGKGSYIGQIYFEPAQCMFQIVMALGPEADRGGNADSIFLIFGLDHSSSFLAVLIKIRDHVDDGDLAQAAVGMYRGSGLHDLGLV
jgi:hypothetical protein